DKKITGKIEFRNVSFAYPSNPDRLVLKNVSFTIQPGQSLALVGPSGSGKSTVVALLERFDPLEGDIYIDDVLVHNYEINHLRSQIGLVSQMPLLFDSSITDNIRGGLTNKTKEEIEHAAKLANAHEFITNTLEKGYNTNVGELGGKLSGVQRIAIARAMLLGPSVLLLDEATSALDTKSEQEVQEALDKIKEQIKQTTVTIAHRLSTIQNSTKILVLVDGEIVEQGSHQELLRANGVYAILCQSQKLLEEKQTMHKQTSQDREQSLIDMANPHMSSDRLVGNFPHVVPNEQYQD
ncbi:multidrug resistance protein, partial [Reticulomyxa filosa]